ncbi:thioredoxin [Clostridium pasteurianum DSM 525 = ATCC 6013]|uniref:Thioredoxin n=1 Tax=Clostridium pasteurianum DSM 525 = ATCC 6013 TaxID=1262449 RepID=A0A0H3JAM4_CLOPA|nr:thioredoxin [Clostridium pasteurianum]AJA49673.1 thioredoxin [Clostridium pasteurianum DSM 525 = ATCC 6013]AJA53661.1 thioredoxin [Clostridium pasteurianum DSM 525 = ATCC 6013]AOZ76824.1 thiol-disulfide isomerase [Clostridium pasteurianum DSM 525 = ATCC 6013]AOZ80621.1 thiol-disulfide isomerase [Clostridium pasteurianum]ELP58812.1 thioredoxin [Clostridium pasteurianum DSM 525 = ATCC 6013]
MVKDINDSNFQEEVKAGTVVVDFWAAWCGPCKMLGPVIEDLSEELNDKAKFVKVNVDENPIVASQYRIASIPTVLVFKDGNVAETLVGFRPKAGLKEVLQKHI